MFVHVVDEVVVVHDWSSLGKLLFPQSYTRRRLAETKDDMPLGRNVTASTSNTFSGSPRVGRTEARYLRQAMSFLLPYFDGVAF